jgi:hypothetical protein
MRKDDVTAELPGVPGRRGRPPSGAAQSGADRQAAYRARQREKGKESLSVTVSAEVREALAKHVEFKDVALGEVVDRILRGYLLRKR